LGKRSASLSRTQQTPPQKCKSHQRIAIGGPQAGVASLENPRSTIGGPAE
jgi:hypothetical protein